MALFRYATSVYGQSVLVGASWDLIWWFIGAGAVSDGLTAMQRSLSNSACSRFTPSGVSAKHVFPPAR